ncbi:MAG: family 31 glucosidase, partial [Lachnospiraceae bacterium]|nr:family 31 glucosidase [Lachnospiraceae bacterium]
MSFEKENGALVCYRNGEKLVIEPWGKDSLRVRATKFGKFTGNDWALTEKVPACDAKIEFFERDHWVGDGTIDKREYASITNGRIKAEINFVGIISFYRDDKLILREYYRSYDGTISQGSRCLKVVNREWKGIIGGSDFSLNVK